MDKTVTAIAASDYAELAGKASEAAGLLKLLANERRLLILCHLAGAGEMSVGPLAALVGLSQSALSQHLALMRQQGLATFRREGQTLYYAISDPAAARFLSILKDIYCAKPGLPPNTKE
jgi:DNA-binding transcriptional ArsR family regulator